MKNINREGILRMIGLRDTAGFLNKINAMYLDIYDEDGKLAEYSTQLIVTSKNITLLAQRVTDNETGIANLTVEYNNISATVTADHSTLTTHTSQISTLRTDLNSISATVTADHTTLGQHTTKIGQLEVKTDSITQDVSSISEDVDTISGKVTTHTSQISTLRTDLNGISATVTADHTTLGTHTTQIGSLQVTTNSISGRVTAIEGDYVKEAEISLMVKKDGSGYISNASIKADNILFTFTRNAEFISNGTTVMNIDTGGNLWIKGEYRGGSITGNITVGTGTNKMYIRPNETDGAELVGYYRNYQTILLGFGAETPAQGVTANVGRLTLSSYVSGSLYRKSVLGPGHFSIYDSSNNIIAQFSAGNNLINGNITVYINGTTYSGVTRDITIGGTTLRITSGIITYVS